MDLADMVGDLIAKLDHKIPKLNSRETRRRRLLNRKTVRVTAKRRKRGQSHSKMGYKRKKRKK